MTREGTNAYLVGGGIASLSAAAYLIRDGGLPGANIHIFEALDVVGGSMEGSGSPEEGYVIRGGRMFNFSYVCTYDLLSFIPSLSDPSKTVIDEFREFNARVKTHADCRLVAEGRKLDVSSMGFSMKDRLDLIAVTLCSEESLGVKRIDECFAPAFFESNFWLMWASMFGFEPWHSAVEFKRYLHRFVHEFSRINTLAGVDRSPYNQYDSVILPIATWLKSQGVQFLTAAEVTDVDLRPGSDQSTVTRIRYVRKGETKEIAVNDSDLVFVTNGSMTAASTLGSQTTAPALDDRKTGDWTLWEKLARNRRDFGRPSVFDDHVDESKWESFTVTCRDPEMFRLIEEFTGNAPGTGALVTIKDSSWLMSIVVAYQPHFLNQPSDVQVFWGYGLLVDRPGDFVKKPMADCTGAEILVELCSHLGFVDSIPKILGTCQCIPCMMPYITSQFLVRSPGDRPDVVPKGSTNLAFIGQFCEQPDDTVFTVEYSVRAAQTAVFTLLKLDKQPPPVYRGDHDPRVLAEALKTMFS
ncbi:MAG: oleate hydratase [Paludisphaera borealis]|uniref:oleate hydratase n=1 Tax=Paludisphaera borealis TaxID=1387353 RepID=UPI0028482EB5|nr:oleate hydratase [Paludisphaera borealis]MDR3623238.1 oleate hydratase [Paludisphaera borealis]